MENNLPGTLSKPTENIPEQKKKRNMYFLFGGVLLLILVLGGILLFARDDRNVVESRVVEETLEEVRAQASPTPFPFQDMTIPYLQSREYTSQLGEMEQVSQNGNYTSYLTSYESDGLRVNGLLAVPSGTPPEGGWPAIVFVHGYIPPSTYVTTQNYADYVDFLARNGFVVFKIDLRGHGNSEGEAFGGYYSGDYIADILNARAALQNMNSVDPAAVGLWGHSMAGNLLLRSMAAQGNIPAAVIWAGAVYSYEDMQKYGIDDNSYRPPDDMSERQRQRQRMRELYGEFDPESSFWKMVPATNYLGDINGAIQLNHAVNDDVVDIGYSRDLVPLLAQAGIPHEIHEYSSGGHNINGTSFVNAMQNTVNFFHEYLK